MLFRQFSIDEVPLGLERATENGIAGYLGRRFELSRGAIWRQVGDIGGWQVEGGELGHLV